MDGDFWGNIYSETQGVNRMAQGGRQQGMPASRPSPRQSARGHINRGRITESQCSHNSNIQSGKGAFWIGGQEGDHQGCAPSKQMRKGNPQPKARNKVAQQTVQDLRSKKRKASRICRNNSENVSADSEEQKTLGKGGRLGRTKDPSSPKTPSDSPEHC